MDDSRINNVINILVERVVEATKYQSEDSKTKAEVKVIYEITNYKGKNNKL
jgi:ribosomal protein S3AE